MNITLTYENDEGEEVELVLPAKNEVCSDCEGSGFVLCEGMRNHAYSAEEFDEAFDDEEDRAAYFQRGGKYDVQCPTCHGKNVVAVVDEEHVPAEKKEEYEAWCESERERRQFEREERREREMGY